MADTRAAKILSPAHRETALCRVLPFVKKKQPSAMQSGMQPCTSCTVWVSAPAAQGSPLPTCLPACLPACRTGPGSHSASQGATKCLAQSPQNL